MSRFYRSVAAIAIATSIYAPTAWASENEATADSGDIVVTAQKTGGQSLQSVPMAIQAFGGEELKARNINDIASLISAIPGAVEAQRQSVGSRSYSIRGAGGGSANGDSPIGYYLDDVPFVVPNFGIAPPVSFLDIQQVEVLRGPQGTLYGQGSAGGVFVFRTRDPDLNEFTYAGEATLGTTRGAAQLNHQFAAAISIPIIEDTLAVRVSAGTSRNAGYADEYYGEAVGTPDEKDVNVARNDDVRVVALWKPAHNVNVRAQYWNFRPRQQFLGFQASVDPAYYANTGGRESFGNGKFTLYSLSASADFDAFSITSATSHMKGEFGIQIPIGAVGAFSSQFFPKNTSQEIRINSNSSGPLHWVAGAQYQDGQGPQANTLITDAGINPADNNTITRNWATFGEVSYDLFDGKLVPLVGLRYYSDKRTFEVIGDRSSTRTNVTTWRANLSYLPSKNLTMFVTASTGFRAGIVQSTLQVQELLDAGIPAKVQLDPERLTNYEVGAKWRSADNALSIALNGYMIKFKDMQTSVPSNNPQVSGFANFGDATTRGIDFDVRWRTPLEGFTLGAVGNVNDGEFDRVNAIVSAALPYVQQGARLFNTAKYNFRMDAGYTGNISSDVELFSNANWTRRGNRMQATGVVNDAYSELGATIGLRKGRYELALVGENLADERGPTLTLNNSMSGPIPRTFSLRLRLFQ
jgi:iron complex outermembrane receptor protein